MAKEIAVCNPSPYQREGHVTMPWQTIAEQTGIDPKNFLLRDAHKNPIPVQIDPVDPTDPSKTTLSFFFSKPIPSGKEDYSDPSALLTIDQGDNSLKADPLLELQVHHRADNTPCGIFLINSRVKVFINLTNIACTEDPDLRNTYYAGSATSYRLLDEEGEWEMLDRFRAEDDKIFGPKHDPLKRVMQIDRLHLPKPAHEGKAIEQIDDLYERSYILLYHSDENPPVRAVCTIASAPFSYSYYDYDNKTDRCFECRLYRVISLFAHTPYVIEELFVKPITCENSDFPVTDHGFETGYFAHMDMGKICVKKEFLDKTWFSIEFPQGPYHGYGFIADVPVGRVTHFSEIDQSYKEFSWKITAPTNAAKCVHFFMHKEHDSLDDEVGRCWWKIIFKPLKATLRR